MELPSIRQLECLVAVAEHLNFRRAAEACHITQPALSTQIQVLERRLGVTLFERDRKRVVVPTEAGRQLAARARDLLSELQDLTESAGSFRQPLSGTLRLGVLPTIAPYVLPRALPEVHRRHPDLRLLLREEHTADLVERLQAGTLDLLLVALEADLGDCQTLPLIDDPFLLAVPPGHRLEKRKRIQERDLASEELLLLEDGHCLRDQALKVCTIAGAGEFGDFRASSLGTLIQMVAGGIGVTLVPEVALDVEVRPDRKVQVLRFSSGGPRRTIGLAWRKASTRGEEFEMFGDAIRRGMRKR